MPEIAIGQYLAYAGYAIAFGIIVYLFRSVVVNVSPNSVVVLERRWFGRKVAQGRILATNGEIGIQAETLAPGLHFLIPFIYKVHRQELTIIGPDQVGLVESIDGDTVPAGHIFAIPPEGHGTYQNGVAFLKNGGCKGKQTDIIPPGEYRINKFLFKVVASNVVIIGPDKIGVVTAQDGKPLEDGRIFAKDIEGHMNFQNAAAFIRNGGFKGVQMEIIRQGTYRLNRWMFDVEPLEATTIPSDQIGIVIAQDGRQMESDSFVANVTLNHNGFQSGSAFIDNGGIKGIQEEILKPGTHYINPLMFLVESKPITYIKPGSVGVIVSNVGKEPTEEYKKQLTQSQNPGDEAFVNDGSESYVVSKAYRGIQKDVLGPGAQYVNPYASTVNVITTNDISIDWDAGTSRESFKPLIITSKDGFSIKVSVKVIIRVRPDQAPYMVAKIGSLQNLVTNVIQPEIDSSFRNQASSTEAMAFMQNRGDEQQKAFNKVKSNLEKYHVECVNVLICDIELPEDLMDVQTSRVIAQQQQETYVQQQKAEESRITVEQTRATADQQPELVRAEINTKVIKQQAEQKVLLAEAEAKQNIALANGNAQSVEINAKANAQAVTINANAEAGKISAIGKANAEATTAVGEAQATAYEKQKEAMGADAIANIKIAELFTDMMAKGNFKLVPDILINGSADAAGNGLGAFMATAATLLPGGLLKNLSPNSDASNSLKLPNDANKKSNKQLNG